MTHKIKWLVIAAFAVAVIMLARSFYYLTPERISDGNYNQIFEEITSLDVSIGSLTPDFSGNAVAYIHSTEKGRGLSIFNLKTSERKEVFAANEVTQMGGWSPDDQHLAFVQTLAPDTAKNNKFNLRESWITFYDRKNDSVRRLTEDTHVFEQYFFWLSSEKYIYSRRRLTTEYSEIMLGNIGSDQLVKVSNYMPELVPMSERLAGYAYKGNLFELEIKSLQPSEKWEWNDATRTVRQLSDFPSDQFEQIKWLRYCRETGRFLFCGKLADANWRNLFQFDPLTKQLSQLSQDDTYNGQWLKEGNGFAYVINTNNSFILAVRPGKQSEHTNLFEKGGIVNYTVAPDGERIYVTGSVAAEPYGIWEYDLRSKNLRQIFNGMNAPFVASRVAQLKEYKIKSFDGVEVPSFLLEPVAFTQSAEKGNLASIFKPRVKYPAVIYIPPPSSQYQRNFGPRSQFLANIGFYFLAVNYRGCDGYGRDYSNLANTANAAQDILAAHRALLKNPNVDEDNVFIFSMSGGTGLCMELMATDPTLWRGIAIDKPGGIGIDKRFEGKKLPPFLFLSGDQDSALPSIKRFQSWASTNHVKVECLYYTNSAHVTFGLSERKSSQNQVAQFFLNHLKK